MISAIPIPVKAANNTLQVQVNANGSAYLEIENLEGAIYLGTWIYGPDTVSYDNVDSLANITITYYPIAGYFSRINLDGVDGEWEGYSDSFFNMAAANHTVVCESDAITASVTIDSPIAGSYNDATGPTLTISTTENHCEVTQVIFDLAWYDFEPNAAWNDKVYTGPIELEVGNGQWNLNVTAYTTEADLTVTDSVTFYRSYEAPTTHTIGATSDSHSSTTPSGAVVVAYGGNQGFTWSSDPGYSVSSVKVDNVAVSLTPPYNFSNVVVDHTIAVLTTANQYVFYLDWKDMLGTDFYPQVTYTLTSSTGTSFANFGKTTPALTYGNWTLRTYYLGTLLNTTTVSASVYEGLTLTVVCNVRPLTNGYLATNGTGTTALLLDSAGTLNFTYTGDTPISLLAGFANSPTTVLLNESSTPYSWNSTSHFLTFTSADAGSYYIMYSTGSTGSSGSTGATGSTDTSTPGDSNPPAQGGVSSSPTPEATNPPINVGQAFVDALKQVPGWAVWAIIGSLIVILLAGIFAQKKKGRRDPNRTYNQPISSQPRR
jgi:hypothetical protein